MHFISCRSWMDGAFEVIDPDDVDAEVGNVWRTFYKLEKTFAQRANPEAMVQKVCKRYDVI